MFLGAAMTEVFSNLIIPHVVDKRDCLVSEQLIGMPLEILGDSLGGICIKVILLQAWILPWELCNPLVEPAVSALQSSIVMTTLEINW